MGGRTIETKADKIGNIKIQTSTYGLGVPIQYGTNRGTGNLIWYGNFKAIPHTESTKAGKGMGKVTQKNTTYTYTAAVMMALGEGPIAGVGKVWKGKDQTTLAAAKLTLHAGASQQTPWAFLQSYNVPSNWSRELAYGYDAADTAPAYTNQALGYDTTSYLVSSAYDLGDSASIPNHGFEIQGMLIYGGGILDAAPKDIVFDFLTNTEHGVGFNPTMLGDHTAFHTYCRAAGIFISPRIEERKAAADYMQEIFEITNTDPLWSEGKLKLLPRADVPITGNGVTYTPNMTPIYDLADNDFTGDSDNGPVRIVRKTPADAKNRVTVEFANRANSYNVEVVSAEDQDAIERFGLKPTQTYQLHSITDSTVAKFVVNTLLYKNLYNRNNFEFGLTGNFALLEPGDYVTITDLSQGIDRLLVRIVEIEEEGENFAVVAEDVLVGTALPALYEHDNGLRFNPNFNSSTAGAQSPDIFELPADATTTGLEIGVATGKTSGDLLYGGCNVWISLDGTDYRQMGTINGSSRYGTLNGTLGPADTSVSVTMLSGGQLPSASAVEADNHVTLISLGNEYLAYETSTLTGADTYTLGGLRRGLYGTTVGTHVAGDKFTRIDDAIARLADLDLDLIGTTVYIKLTAFNTYEGGEEDLANVVAYTYTISGYMELLGRKAELNRIGDDDWLTPDEKITMKREYDLLLAEHSGILARADSLGVVTERNNFDTEKNELVTYITSLNPAYTDFTQSTAIVRANFNDAWNDYFLARQILQDANDLAAGRNTEAQGTSSLFFNQNFDIVAHSTNPLRPAGLVAHNDASPAALVPTALAYTSGAGSDLRVGTGVTENINVSFPLFRVNGRSTYRIRIKIRASAVTTSGFYIRIAEQDNEQSSSVLRITRKVVTGDTSAVQQSRDKQVGAENMALTASYQTLTYTYTPTSTNVKLASLTILKWSGMGSAYLEVESLVIEEVTPTSLSLLDPDQNTVLNRHQPFPPSINIGAIGNVILTSNQIADGTAKDGEIRVQGDTLYVPGRGKVTIAQTLIETPFESTVTIETFFIILGVANVQTRFPTYTLVDAAANGPMFVAHYNWLTATWYWRDNANESVAFSPLSTDCIVAQGHRGSTTGGIQRFSSLLHYWPDLPEDGATVGAPNGTYVGGVLAEALSAGVVNATDDDLLTPLEKFSVIIPTDSFLDGEYTSLTTRATLIGLTFAALTTAKTNWESLLAGLTPAWDDVTVNTPITRTTFRSTLTAYRQELSNLYARLSRPPIVVDPVEPAVPEPDMWWQAGEDFNRWDAERGGWDRFATVGARVGTNFRRSGGLIPTSDSFVFNDEITMDGTGFLNNIGSTATVRNSNLTIASSGELLGGGGGDVTIAGLGYSGDLNATYGARIGTSTYGTDGTTLLGGEDLLNSSLAIEADMSGTAGRGRMRLRRGTSTYQSNIDLPANVQNIFANFAPRRIWHFDTSTETWGGTNLTATQANGSLIVTGTATNDPMLRCPPSLTFIGRQNYVIRARMRRISADPAPLWEGNCYYDTATAGAYTGHSESGLFYKKITESPEWQTQNAWFIAEWDMSALTAGGTDFVDNTITRFRLDFTQLANTTVEIDWIAIGDYGAATYGAQVGVTTFNGNTVLGGDDLLNANLALESDTSGTGGRPRVRLRRGTSTYNTNLTLPDNAWNGAISISSGLIGGIGTGNNAAVGNSLISIAASGELIGGGGGDVTIGGLGYTGALNATYGARVGTSTYAGDGTTVLNADDLLNANLAVLTDTGGTGGRARVRLRRGTSTFINSEELPSNVQNVDQLYTQVKARPETDLILEDFSMADEPAFSLRWTRTNGGGELIPGGVDASVPGGKFVRIGNNLGDDEGWFNWIGDPVPFDPTALYEIEFIVRRVLGAGVVYLGLEGLAADRVTRVNATGANSASSQHYTAASGAAPTIGVWTTYKGYVKGRSASGGAPSNNPSAPSTMHDSTVYIRPMFLVNYDSVPGTTDIAFCRLRKVEAVRAGSMILSEDGSTPLTDVLLRNDQLNVSSGRIRYGTTNVSSSIIANEYVTLDNGFLTNDGGVTDIAAVQNSLISIAASGELAGGGGGDVTIAGLGYSGALNATFGADFYSNLTSAPLSQIMNVSDAVAMGFNPSFNDWPDGANHPTGWSSWSGAPSRATSPVRVGRYSAKYVVSSGISLGMVRGSVNHAPTALGTFVSGAFDCYIETFTSGGAPGILVDLLTDTSGNYTRTIVSADTGVSGSWQRIPFTARVPTGSRIHAVRIYVMGAWNGMPGGLFVGTVYFDNLDFYYQEGSTDNQRITISAGLIDGIGAGDGVRVDNDYVGVVNGRLTNNGGVTESLATIGNSLISIASTGELAGAGGGDVTFAGLGGGTVGTRNYVHLGTGGLMRDSDGATELTPLMVRNASQEADLTRIAAPQGGAFSSGPVTGPIEIKLPQFRTNTMVRFDVEIYDYATGKSETYTIGGYNYEISGVWHEVFATRVGNGAFKAVRFGETADNKSCVWIGETGTGWSYPKVRITNVSAGHSNHEVNKWETGWAVQVNGNASPFNNVTRTISYPTAGPSVLGVNAYTDLGANLLTDTGSYGVRNNGISIASTGELAGGGGGDVTLSGIAPNVDSDADSLSRVYITAGRLASTRSGGVYLSPTDIVSNAYVSMSNGYLTNNGGASTVGNPIQNSLISIASTGELAGGGGGDVTISGLAPNLDWRATAGDNLWRNGSFQDGQEGYSFTGGAVYDTLTTIAPGMINFPGNLADSFVYGNYSQYTPIVGNRIFVSADIYPNQARSFRFGVHFQTANGDDLGYGSYDIAMGTGGWQYAAGSIAVPATAARFSMYVQALGNFSLTDHMTNIKFSWIENSADVTSMIAGAADIVVNCDSSGNPLAGQDPKTEIYRLIKNGVVLTANVSWAWQVLTGLVAGAGPSSTWYTSYVTGAGSATIDWYLDSTEAKVRVRAIHDGSTRTFDVVLRKSLAAPATTGSSGGGTGGSAATDTTFAAVGTTATTVFSDELQITLGSTKTQADLSAALETQCGQLGTHELNAIWQWYNGASWQNVGVSAASNPDAYTFSDAEGNVESSYGALSVAAAQTGLTAGSTHKFRLVGWRTSGSSLIYIYGTASAQG